MLSGRSHCKGSGAEWEESLKGSGAEWEESL